jgi:hypothetical protein
MREGSTLNADLLPDMRGCVLQQPLALPKRSEREAVIQLGILVGITIGFDMFLDNIAVFAFFMMISLRLLRLSIGLLLCLFIHRNVPAPVIAPFALGLLLYQSALLTRHWVYLVTATWSPQVTRQARTRLGPSLAWSLVFLPLTLLRGAFCLLAEGDDAWKAWVSYLNYGRGGVKAPGAFRSPAGDHAFRLNLFYAVGGAVTLALGKTPMPFLEMIGPETVLVLVLFCVVPALVCTAVPALVLAPQLVNIQRIRRESHP